MSETALLQELNKQVTLELNEHVPMQTGVPASVTHTTAINKLMDMCTKIRDEGREHKNHLNAAVSKAVDEKVRSEGGVNSSILSESLLQLKEELFGKIKSIRNTGSNNIELGESGLPIVEPTVQIANSLSFMYKGSICCIPESFMFPHAISRLNGWRRWLLGAVQWLVQRHGGSNYTAS